jgi:ferredoxin
LRRLLACASCLVVVREGGEVLSLPSEDEIDMLDRAGVARDGARLACQPQELAKWWSAYGWR